MAITFLAGFEARAQRLDLLGGSLNGGTWSYSTSTFRTGLASLRVNPASGVNGFVGSGWSSSVYEHWGLYIASMPTVTRSIRGNQAGAAPDLRLNSDGTLTVRNGSGVGQGTSSIALSTGQWYWVGVHWGTYTGVLLQINGIDATGSLSVATGAADTNFGCLGTEASALDIFFDDIIISDSGFLAPSNVPLLKPISDNSNTSWTAGLGGVSNLWQGVSNTPPAGVLSANETNTTNIESASGSGTANYIANLTTYTNAGIGAADSVLAVSAIVEHGEDIATGTKTGSVTVTNPTIAASTFTFGNDVGAHGVSPTNWGNKFSAVTNASAVTLGTSPTINIIKTDTTTRTACIDFMGMYVAYTPAAVTANPPYRNPMPPLIAQ
jgi:hypothetical protein